MGLCPDLFGQTCVGVNIFSVHKKQTLKQPWLYNLSEGSAQQT